MSLSISQVYPNPGHIIFARPLVEFDGTGDYRLADYIDRVRSATLYQTYGVPVGGAVLQAHACKPIIAGILISQVIIWSVLNC